MRERRQAGQRDDADVSPADARLGAGNELLVAEHRIEWDRTARRLDLADASVDAAGDVREQRRHVERHELPHRAHRVREFLELLFEPLPLAIAPAPAGARDEYAAQLRLRLRNLSARDAEHGPALVVAPFLSIVERAFVADHRAHRIGESAFGK